MGDNNPAKRPEVREKIAVSKLGKSLSEEHRRKISEGHSDVSGKKNPMYGKTGENRPRYGKKNTTESRQKISEKAKERLKIPENNPFYGKKHTLETRHKMSINHADVSGEKCHLWKGGISYFPYCPKFNFHTKERVRERFNRKCFLCSITEIENGKRLAVHHVNYNKNTPCNGKEWPLLPLCMRCHTKTNSNRWHWFNMLINYWAMNTEINL